MNVTSSFEYGQYDPDYSYMQNAPYHGFEQDTYYPSDEPRGLRQQPAVTVALQDVSYRPVFDASSVEPLDLVASSRNGSLSSTSNSDEYYSPSQTSPRVQNSRPRPQPRYTNKEQVYGRGYDVEIKPAKSSQRFYCDFVDCVDDKGRRCSVSRKADLKRHMKSVHGPPVLDCKYPKCDRKRDNGFRRRDHYMEHLRGYHMEATERKGVQPHSQTHQVVTKYSAI